MKPALFCESEGENIRCRLCPHECLIFPGGIGKCGTRKHSRGKLYAAGYGRLMAMHLDPIEKKPLRQFMPGSSTFSIGFAGCNLFCPYCQNSTLSRARPHGPEITPEEVLDMAMSQGAPSIAYTYSEPLVQFEFIHDTAVLAHKAGLKNVLVSNGYINDTPLQMLFHKTHPLMDAVNFDIKTSRPDVFRRICGGELDSVWHTVETVAGRAHMEITALMVPGVCDVTDVVEIAARISPLNAPLHITRYFPMGSGPATETPEEAMRIARRLAKKYVKDVYLGNL